MTDKLYVCVPNDNFSSWEVVGFIELGSIKMAERDFPDLEIGLLSRFVRHDDKHLGDIWCSCIRVKNMSEAMAIPGFSHLFQYSGGRKPVSPDGFVPLSDIDDAGQ